MGRALTLLVTGIVFLVKILFWLFRVTVRALGEIIVFFSLYIPGLFLIFGAVLSKYFGLNISTPGLERTLFIIGIVLCFLCSAIITVRKLILTPINTVFSGMKKRTKKEFDTRPDFREEEKKFVRRTTSKYPLEYRSKLYPEIKVREWSDRFELYVDDGEGEKFYKVEYKNNRDDYQ